MKFDKIIYVIINEKRYIFLFNNINIIIFAHRNNKNKKKYLIKKKKNYNDYREICDFYKIINRKFKYFSIKY